MKSKIIAMSLVALTATSVSAAENPFNGFFVGLNVSSVGAITELSGGNSADLGQQTIVPSIEASYAYGMSDKISMGVTGTYDLSNTKGGSSGNNSFKGKNHYSINFKPGYVVSPNTMLYALIGYHSVDGNLLASGVSSSKSFNGVGAGFGLQTLVSKDIYVKAEAQHIMYSAETSGTTEFSPSKTTATLGIGFKY